MSHKILLKYITFYQNFEISLKWMKNILIIFYKVFKNLQELREKPPWCLSEIYHTYVADINADWSDQCVTSFLHTYNPIALRTAKTLWSFGFSERNRFKAPNMKIAAFALLIHIMRLYTVLPFSLRILSMALPGWNLFQNFADINFVYCIMVISKQCRPRSDTTWCGIWSGSTMFANRIFHRKQSKTDKINLTPLKWQMD